MRRFWDCFILLKITKCECICCLSGFFLFSLDVIQQPKVDDFHLLIRVVICSYGYLTNTKVKFILVTTDLDVKDADVRNVSINRI